MKFSLIGMSGTGKTYWSKELEKRGFKRFSCDVLLGKKLVGEFDGIRSVARWMGRPSDIQYKKTSKEYLACEQKALDEILKFVEECSDNVVIDTTGSVVYLDKNILRELAVLTKIIYLKIPDSYYGEMEKKYFSDPKPVIWGSAKNYRDLLAFRARKYEQLADFTVDFTTDNLLESINVLQH